MEGQNEEFDPVEQLKNAVSRMEELQYMLEQSIARASGLNRLIREKDQQLEKLTKANEELQEQLRGRNKSPASNGAHVVPGETVKTG